VEKKGKILIIDDNEDVLFALNVLLSPYVEKVKVSAFPEKIEHYMLTYQPDVIFLDMNFHSDVVSGQEGFHWLDKILKADPHAIVIFMTAYADTDKAVKAIKAGAVDFISKPWEKEKLLATLFSALKLKESQREVESLKKQMEILNTTETAYEIIGESDAMRKIFDIIEKLSGTDANILLLGENGTGKDLIARAIYHHSPRAGKVFVSIDMGTIPDTLFESELFGYEKGAFTDAKKEKPGRIEAASGGTLFLDEIANLSLPMQAKILTAIEKRTISRLGSNQPVPIDVRLISATNTDIYREVENGNFRQDLLYRINTIELRIPPLRDRGNDILLLANHFLQKFNIKYKKHITGFTSDAKTKLAHYNWPGNVRELQNTVERAVILSSGNKLNANDFILQLPEIKRKSEQESLNLKTIEQETIEKAIQRSHGNLNKAAELLGISRFALYRKVKNEQI
jgi:DNA-binding NtrC family response regulator